MSTENLGIVAAIHVGSTAPTNTKMIWYNTGDDLHYYYNIGTASWELLRSTKKETYTVNVVVGLNSVAHTIGNNEFAVIFQDSNGREGYRFNVDEKTSTVLRFYSGAVISSVKVILIG